MKKNALTILIISIFLSAGLIAEEGRLLRFPNSSATQITFAHSGDIYVVDINGGLARRVTSCEGDEMFPRFSPDGKTLAFTAEYDGNREIYVMPALGGTPTRLTYSMDHDGMPERMGPDKIIMQWTPNGKLLYNTRAVSWHSWVRQLFTIDATGGLPEQIEVPKSGFAYLSPDGTKLAYNRVFREFRTWKRYRGGQADDIWIYDLKSKKLENITNNPAQDIIPMWAGNKIYFNSDRDKIMNLFCYDLVTKETKKITNFDKYDVKFPSLGSNHIAFENGGYVYLVDLATQQVKKVNIEIQEDFPDARNKIVGVSDKINGYDLSPDANRAVFTARGDIFTVPAEKGNIRNLTTTPGVHERAATWSPDGKYIAYLSDESGESEIWLMKPDGKDKKQITTDATTYRYSLKWSPDSKKLLCSDKEMKLYYIDIDSKKITNITQSKNWEINDYTWSPDSKWVAFSDAPTSQLSSVFLYSLESGAVKQVTNEFFDSGQPEFSSDGKYLFFVSDRTFNASISSYEWNYSYNNLSKIYGITLAKETESPFRFESDESQIKDESKDSEKKDKDKKDSDKKGKDKSGNDEVKPLTIDFDGIIDRVFVLPMEASNYNGLHSTGNKLYYLRFSQGKKPSFSVYDLEKKKNTDIIDISNYSISANEKKIIFRSGSDYYITDLGENIKTSSGRLNLDDMEVSLDKKAEWKQIFVESWRQMRDFFYDPNMHGVDWKSIKTKYEELLPSVHSRSDLTYIIGEMIGELNIGHAYTGGGEKKAVEQVTIAYLGAEYQLDKASGFYKITKIFNGRNWEEKTRSPLTEPGINVKVGDYLIEIDGHKLSADNQPAKMLINKTGKYVSLKINSKPSEDGAKEYNVKTIHSEKDLRYFDWVENNRRKVDEATNGKVAYIHIPDMGVGNGLNEFVKYFYPQVRKEAMIVDDRYNGGGNVSPMIIERLRRILLIAGIARNQQIVTTKPDAVMTGPMVCLINELSASDGDMFPYQFKRAGLGKLIGKRSWGGVVGIRGSLPFLDGGYLMKPEFAHFSPDGTWVLEGTGMSPDIEVDNLPDQEWNGIDQQLNKAIEVIKEDMKTDTKPKVPVVPPYPIKN